MVLQSKAMIMISGYESEMYNSYLIDWNKYYFQSCAEHGKPRQEVIWVNYEINQQMDIYNYLN